MGQKDRLLEHFTQGNRITRAESYTELGIIELSARVIDLEKAGYEVCRKRIKVTNRFGEQISVAQYWMEV